MERQLSKNLRPGERVLEYLEREFLSGDEVVGTRLPTIEAIAAHLEVGISTVRSVIRKLSDEGRLETRKGRGTLLKAPVTEAPLRLATDIGPIGLSPESPGWGDCIYLGAAKMSAIMKHPISMLPVATEEGLSRAAMDAELLRRINSIDLLMLFPPQEGEPPDHRELIATFEQAGKPVVNINPPSLSSTTNFVSANFFEAAYRIGRSWYQAGRRRFLFVVPEDRIGNVSAQLYLAGFSSGSKRDEDRSVRFEVCTTEANTEEAGEWAAQQALKNEEPPDAVLCFGDILAAGFLRGLKASSLNIPEELSLIGGTGLPSTRQQLPELNIILQPMTQIGAGVVRLLSYRKENGCMPVPGLYLSCKISDGTTVRPEELSLMANPTH